MYEFLQNNAIFVVLMIVVVIWFGIAYYLLYLDRKVNRLEKNIEEVKENNKIQV